MTNTIRYNEETKKTENTPKNTHEEPDERPANEIRTKTKEKEIRRQDEATPTLRQNDERKKHGRRKTDEVIIRNAY